MKLDRVIGALTLLAIHEIDVLAWHWQWLKQSRRNGWHGAAHQDLRSTWREDRAIRQELWRSLYQDVRELP